MKLKIGGYLIILAVGMTFLAGCEGGSDTTAKAPVLTVLNNPVLTNYSTIVAVNFSNYTTYVKFGSPVTFTVSPVPASLSHVSPPSATFSNVSTVFTRTVKTDVGGMAWVTVRSPLPGRFIVSAIAGPISGGITTFGGSTTVSFIDQPAAVSVLVGLRTPITNLEQLDFDLVSTQPAPSFVNFSGSKSPLLWAEDTTPILPGTGVATTNLFLNSLKGISFVALKPLFRYDFIPVPPSVPNFTLANITGNLVDNNHTPISPSLYIIKTMYFDAAGDQIFSIGIDALGNQVLN